MSKFQMPETWTAEEKHIASTDGKNQLFVRQFKRKSQSTGRALLLAHGMGEHSARYAHVVAALESLFDSIVLYDHVGHGMSTGVRGHVEQFDILAQDFSQVLQQTIGDSAAEIHLIGHSLGGHIVLRYLLTQKLPQQLKSVTCSAPFLGIKVRVPWIKKKLGFMLSDVWGSLALGTGLDPKQLSRDPLVVEAYRKDPLVHSKMSPRFFTSMLSAMEDTLSRGSEIKTPIQFIVPMADQIVDSELALSFFKTIPEKTKKNCVRFAEMRHEPMNEIGKEEVIQSLAQWVQK